MSKTVTTIAPFLQPCNIQLSTTKNRPMALPEPLTGLIVLGVGWGLGKADRWFSHNSTNERDTLIALRELALTVKHLDNSITTLDSSICALWDRLNNHERRISHMEGRSPAALPAEDPA